MTHRSLRQAAVLGTAALGLGLGLVVPGGGASNAVGTACPVPSSDVSGGIGSDSGGDPYFPADGNGGYDVHSYDLDLTYRPDPTGWQAARELELRRARTWSGSTSTWSSTSTASRSTASRPPWPVPTPTTSG